MIIEDPGSAVIGFGLFEWLMEDEPCPKKEVRNFLKGLYEEISGKKAGRVVGDEGGENEEGKEEEEDSTRKILVEALYEHFSLTDTGAILLSGNWTGEDDDEEEVVELMLTEKEAQDLLPMLKTCIQKRITRVAELLK